MVNHAIDTSENGIALVVAVLVVAVLSGLGLSLLVTLAIEPRAGANQRDSAAALHAADAALELAVLDLDRTTDWNTVLAGTVRSTRTDGAPSGARVLSTGETIDLSVLTSQITCGRPTGCSDTERIASTLDRPWGQNNPIWQPFLYGTPAALGLTTTATDYLIVWIGDDGMETDGDPATDGSGVGGLGRLMLRLRVVAVGPRGARRSLEAIVARRCDVATGLCDVGSHVQSWRALHGSAP